MTTLVIKDLARVDGLDKSAMRRLAGGNLIGPHVDLIPPELQRFLPFDLPWQLKPMDPRNF